ncbi:MAG: tetratricopeptide repeat protein [Clostridiales bacterium]|nr:tetratricopeptide repeat protein [Clostridiales bacterium]
MNAKEMAEGFKRINELAMKALSAGEHQEAIAIFKEGLILEEKLGLQTQMAQSYANIGNAYLSVGELAEAQRHIEKAQKIFQKTANTEGVISALLTIATIRQANGDEADAQKQLDDALRMTRNGEQRGMVLYRIACHKQQTGSNYQAQEAYSRALLEMERLNRPSDILFCLLARASLFKQMDRQVLATRDIARAKSLALSHEKLMERFINAVAELGLE